MLDCSLQAVGLIAPGMPDWDSARAVLRGEIPWQPAPIERPSPALLPANERRRATPLTRLALSAAQQVLDRAAFDPLQTPSVFATAGGDLEIGQKICKTLLLPGRPVSPMVFHNSVHNATAGYFSIASGSRCASTSIAAGPGTAAAGLLEAALIAHSEQRATLLLIYDAVPSAPLAACTGLSLDLASALLISPDASAGRRLRLSLQSDDERDDSRLPAALRAELPHNPAAAVLPLLALAAGATGGVTTLPQQHAGNLRLSLGDA